MSLSEVKIKIVFPYDQVNKNGVLYTKEAVEKAVKDLCDIPILAEKGNKRVVVGYGTRGSTEWNDDNNQCTINIDGALFNAGVSGEITEMVDNLITGFRITSMSIMPEQQTNFDLDC